MTHLRVDDSWTQHGLQVIRLENEHISLDILPERGANVFRVIDKARDLDLLWKSPRITPHLAALHADFDDHWAGGWDDAFPGGRASRNRYGDLLPYMGEVWPTRASYRIDEVPGRISVTTVVHTPVTPARLVKTISLAEGASSFELSYTLENMGTLPFDYNWGIHPSLGLRPGMRFDIPARHGLVDEAGGEWLGRPGDEYAWPHLDGVDVRIADFTKDPAFALHYLTGLEAGWACATDVPDKRGFGLAFDHELFPVVWLCLVYGGWRGYHQVLIEPWTGYPSPLDEAVAAGRARILDPGDKQETTVTAVLYDGVESVGFLSADGTVLPQQ